MRFLDEIIVYSAVFGSFDKIMTAPKFAGVRFILFTDDKELNPHGWEVIFVNNKSNDPRKLAKQFKILPHKFFPEYRWSVWMDGTHMLRIHPRSLIKMVTNGILLFRHPKRDCIYEEAKVCKSLGFDKVKIDIQMQRYVDKGFPAANGLSQCTVLVREHNNPVMCKMMNDWWDEVNMGSIRDQLSFDFIAWQLNIKPNYIEGNPYWNKYFYYTPHGKDPSRLISFVESFRDSRNIISNYVFSIKDCLARMLS